MIGCTIQCCKWHFLFRLVVMWEWCNDITVRLLLIVEQLVFECIMRINCLGMCERGERGGRNCNLYYGLWLFNVYFILFVDQFKFIRMKLKIIILYVLLNGFADFGMFLLSNFNSAICKNTSKQVLFIVIQIAKTIFCSCVFHTCKSKEVILRKWRCYSWRVHAF